MRGAQRLSASKESPPLSGLQVGLQSNVLNACRRQRNLHKEDRTKPFQVSRCSTPVGVKGISTSSTIRSMMPSRCAQRLSASKESPRPRPRKRTLGHLVLNACRRQRNLHLFLYAAQVIGVGCSTPVGVKGISTAAFLPTRTNCSCAQRLSASKESPRPRPRKRTLGHLVLNACRRQRNLHLFLYAAQVIGVGCSTPVGVKGISTAAPTTRSPSAVRCSTPVGVKGISTAMSRLQPSQPEGCSTPVGVKGISTAAFLPTRTNCSCAQRLSASKESPRPRPRKRTLGHLVLNACRRQRNLHSDKSHRTGVIDACSTPVGVKGISTLLTTDQIVELRKCSTPVGVKGISTGCLDRPYAQRTSAQRLSASKESPPATIRWPSSSKRVLNACRRQRNLHTKLGKLGAASIGAQRLSASKESHRRVDHDPDAVHGVLNACRRQRNLHPQ